MQIRPNKEKVKEVAIRVGIKQVQNPDGTYDLPQNIYEMIDLIFDEQFRVLNQQIDELLEKVTIQNQKLKSITLTGWNQGRRGRMKDITPKQMALHQTKMVEFNAIEDK